MMKSMRLPVRDLGSASYLPFEQSISGDDRNIFLTLGGCGATSGRCRVLLSSFFKLEMFVARFVAGI